MAAHILIKATLRSATIIGLGRILLSFLWILFHKCSIGLGAGHGMILMLCCWRKFLVALVVLAREHVMLVTAKIGHNVKSKDLINISQSRDAITSTWANILKDYRSRFMNDPDGPPHVSSHIHLHNVPPILHKTRTLRYVIQNRLSSEKRTVLH